MAGTLARTLLKAAVSAGLLVWLFRGIDIGQVRSMLVALPISCVVAAAALVSCPLIGRLREWTSTEPGEGRRGGAGGAVLGYEIGALDRCSNSERYPEAGYTVSSHAQVWR